jgi:hypothetical protein
MDTSLRQSTDEFKREAGLLARSGRPLRQIARSWGSPLRGRASGGTRVMRGSRRGAPIRRQRSRANLAAENARPRRENERLHIKSACIWSGRFEKNAAHLLASAAMKFRLIEDQRDTFKVRAMGDVLGVSKALYDAWYDAWRSRPEGRRKAVPCWPGGSTRHIAGDMARLGSTRPCVAEGRRRAQDSRDLARRTPHASALHPGTHAAPVSGAHHKQPSRLADRCANRPSWQHGHIRFGWPLRANLRRMALSGRRAQSLHPQNCWMGDA